MHPRLLRLFSGNLGNCLGFSPAKEMLEDFARLSGTIVEFTDESGTQGDLRLRLEVIRQDGEEELHVGWRNVKSLAYLLKRSQEKRLEALNLQPTSC